MCVCVFVVVVVVQCVCAHALALCCGSLGLHAAVRTYLPPARACDVPPRVCVCVCVCVCVRTGPLLWKLVAARSCADLFVARLCV